MKYCSRCGAALPDDAVFCNQCGHPAEDQQPEQAQPAQENFEQAESCDTQYQQPVYEQPGCGQPSAPGDNGQGSWMPETPVKKKKKLTWLWIVLGVLVAAGAAVAIWFFCFNKTPEDRLSEAAAKTEKQQQVILENAVNLNNFSRYVTDYNNTGKITLYTVADGAEIELQLRSAIDPNRKIAVYEYDYDISAEGNHLPLKFQAAMNEKEIQIALPELLGDVYSIPFDEANLSSELFSAYKNMAEGRNFLENLGDYTSLGEVADDTVRFEDGQKECQIYNLEPDEELLKRIEELLGAFASQIEDFPIRNFAYIVEDGLLRGLRFDVKDGRESHEISILLEGEENPWTHITFREDGKVEGEMSFDSTDSGFELKLIAEGEELLRITCDDEEQKIVLAVKGKEIVFRYGLQGNEAHFEIESDEFRMKLTAGPDNQLKAEMLSHDAVDVTKMDQADFQKMMQEIYTSLFLNPDTQWIYGSILN